MGNVAPPSGGLASNSNYFLYAGGNPMQNISVTVDLTQDLLTNIGFAFQLNAYSPAGATSAWQQYFFSFRNADGLTGGSPNTLYGCVEPWPKSTAGLGTDTTTGDLINYQPVLLTQSNANFAAGHKFIINLGNEANGNVRYVTFTVLDQNNQQVGYDSIDITSLTLDGSSNQATEADLAPILAYQFNIVGPINSEQTLFTSGAGNITYAASNEMTVRSALPGGVDSNWHTLENGNSVYGTLPQESSKSFTQSFTSVEPPAYVPGGPLAVSRQVSLNQTNVYGIDRTGQPVVFYVDDAGHWSSTAGIGPTGLAIRGAGLAASQQFGALNQTDLFLVSQNGQLNVFWVEGAGAWNGPVAIGSGGNFPSGAALAASQQFGAPNQTDVFLFDSSGQLNVFWVQSAGSWGGPVKVGDQGIAPAGGFLAASRQYGAPDQTDVLFFDNNGQLNVFWVQGTGNWGGPVKIGAKNTAPAGAALAVSQQFGAPNQTDVYFIDHSGQLNVFWVQGTGDWGGPVAISATNIAPPGGGVAACRQFGATNQTDALLIDNNGQLNVFWVQNTGNWNGPAKIGPTKTAAPGAAIVASQQFGISNQTDVFVMNQNGTHAPGWPVVFWVDSAGQWNGPKALQAEV
jgi:hypothetical protein